MASTRRLEPLERTCEHCGKRFLVYWERGQRFCGNSCAAKHRKGPEGLRRFCPKCWGFTLKHDDGCCPRCGEAKHAEYDLVEYN